ncbi:hypothetical protein E2562_034565 [Oryza meyeriana var. granulata]|uniref:Uncharacterized protein n=1 Tax=Oryza meyeriana var. granulata TaxID=110450 RepID=A0A6G1CUZ6_9ORYZ|nr:hypothetical protein E2562_034565 [Oryza meyeriana var. granulata]
MASCWQLPGLGAGQARRRRSLVLHHLLLVVVVAGVAPAGVNGAQTIKSRFKAIFMFGDSIVDPGNNNARLTEARADFPPYGQDFPGGVATGRFSNGKVPGDLLASKLGIKDLLSPYNDPNLELSDLLTGVAFASGGSGYDPLTSIPSTAISSSGQLDLFSDYKQKLTSLIGEEAMTRVLSKAVFFTVMGANDILNNYFSLPVRQHQYDIPGYVDFLVSNAVNFTLKMNEMGAKMIGFVGVPPLGCCPSQRTGPSRECEPLRNQASELFNTRIKQEIDRLNAERNIDGSRFLYIDIYYNLLDLIQQPGYYGFKDASDGCCGNTVLNAAIFIKYHSACPNVYDYIFWDSFHPSEKAYDIVVDKLIEQNKQYLM